MSKLLRYRRLWWMVWNWNWSEIDYGPV